VQPEISHCSGGQLEAEVEIPRWLVERVEIYHCLVPQHLGRGFVSGPVIPRGKAPGSLTAEREVDGVARVAVHNGNRHHALILQEVANGKLAELGVLVEVANARKGLFLL
jgi:hypothetical protein